MAKYIYYNVNPRGEEIGDCVIRAISLATNIDYYEIERLLYETGDYYKCEELCVCCYSRLLEEYFNLEPIECEGMTANEFANKYPVGTYLIRMDAHLSVVIDSNIYDIWNCGNEKLTIAWRVD